MLTTIVAEGAPASLYNERGQTRRSQIMATEKIHKLINDFLEQSEKERHPIKLDVLLREDGWTPKKIAKVLGENGIDFQWDLPPMIAL